jgi:hypothetical protein
MKQYLIVIILLLFLYYLNSVRSESFQCELSYKIKRNTEKKTVNNIVVQVIQTNSNLNNYINADFCNLRIIRYLNDIFSSTDNVFKLKKMLPVNYKNNLINSYHHVINTNYTTSSLTPQINEEPSLFNPQINDVPTTSSLTPQINEEPSSLTPQINDVPTTTSLNPHFKTSDNIDEFVNNDLELFDILLRKGGNINDLTNLLKRIINTEYLDDSTINIVFVPYIKNNIIKLTLDYSGPDESIKSYNIIVCGMYNNNNNYNLTIPYIPLNLKKNWVSNYMIDSNYKSRDTTAKKQKKKDLIKLYVDKKKKIKKIKTIKDRYKDLDKDEYYKNIKKLQKLYLTDMKDIPIINNYIKNKKSQKKFDELFYKPSGPFNSKYKLRNKNIFNKNIFNNDVNKIKEEISRLENDTKDYKKKNNEKTMEIKPLKKELKKIDEEIYDLHRLKPLDYETYLQKQQRAVHNKKIYMNKMYFDKLDIILTMAEYISNINPQIVNPISDLHRPSSTTQTTITDKISGCDLFDDDVKPRKLCEEKEKYIYDVNILVPTSKSSNLPVEDNMMSFQDVVSNVQDDACVEVNNKNIPQHKLNSITKTIGDVKFKIPKNQQLYNRQIKKYLNSNDYYLNRFSDSYI